MRERQEERESTLPSSLLVYYYYYHCNKQTCRVSSIVSCFLFPSSWIKSGQSQTFLRAYSSLLLSLLFFFWVKRNLLCFSMIVFLAKSLFTVRERREGVQGQARAQAPPPPPSVLCDEKKKKTRGGVGTLRQN